MDESLHDKSKFFFQAVMMLTLVAFGSGCNSDTDTRDLISRVTVASNGYTGIQIDTDNTIVEVDGHQQLSLVAVINEAATNESLAETAFWSSSDTSIATVDRTGLVTGVADGTIVVSGRFGPLTDSITLTSSSATVVDIIIEPSSATVNECGNTQLSAIANYSDGSTRGVTNESIWSVTDTSTTGFFSTTDPAGLLRNSNAGTVNVIATREGVESAGASITVSENLSSIDVPEVASTLTLTTPVTYSAIGTYLDNSTADITDNANWSVDDTSVSNVDNVLPIKGQISATLTGNITMTASCGGVADSLTVRVGDPTIVESISFNQISPLVVNYTGGVDSIQLRSIATLEDQSEVDITEDSDWVLFQNNGNFRLSNSSGSKGLLTITGTGVVDVQVEYTGDTFTSGTFNLPRLEVNVR